MLQVKLTSNKEIVRLMHEQSLPRTFCQVFKQIKMYILVNIDSEFHDELQNKMNRINRSVTSDTCNISKAENKKLFECTTTHKPDCHFLEVGDHKSW